MTFVKCILPLLAATASVAVAAPAAAQMNHSNMPGMTMPMPAKKAPAKKPAAKKTIAKKPMAKKPAAKKAGPKKPVAQKGATKPADPHAGHDMSSMPGMQTPAASAPPQTTCLPEHAAMGHCTLPTTQPAPPPEPTCMPEHAAMGHCTPATTNTAEGTSLPAGNAPPPPVPTDHAGDAVYGTPAMEMGRHHLKEFHGDQKFFQALLNVFEAQLRNGRDGYEWDGEAWYGGDINRLWLKSEGEGAFGRPVEKAEVQALYSRAIGPYFNVQGGVRYDFKPNPSRVYATVGFEGLAPSFFDVEGALFLSNKGELMARLEGYYDQRITQRLILQPRAELNFAAQSSREIGVGKGLSDAELGLRLRYDIRREFAPYIGVQYRRAFGDTRQFLRAEGEDAAGWSVVSGIRMWF
ncbi:copper resistance protein B [Sphingomonas xanthus]|uniref:Copper resistance protein B n=1 Tax=Sphingomonas xanthus TaxID=2594473 RepID=A0A516IQ50_9SPHN|nr:copper resistance protein B [Sphingomonas xanthus]QDP19045.1 copper resistance protein B [Sphingomonas xanthus]